MDLVFAVTAGVSIGAGLLVVTQRNPIYSAISLLACFLAFAVIYLKLDAPFLAAMHVLVYTGAILVLFLFVIMLLNLKQEEFGKEYPLRTKAVFAVLCVGLFVLLAVPLSQDPVALKQPAAPSPSFGSIEDVGSVLFNDYALPFELISVLILAAIFGSVILAKKKL
jgi:NADH-quinone oxidoreductase subunit J